MACALTGKLVQKHTHHIPKYHSTRGVLTKANDKWDRIATATNCPIFTDYRQANLHSNSKTISFRGCALMRFLWEAKADQYRAILLSSVIMQIALQENLYNSSC